MIKLIITSLVLSILTIVLTKGQSPPDQFFQNQFQPNNVPTTAPTPTVSGTITTASPQYLDCLRRCPSVNQYNPVCGTDNVSYNSRFRLACAQQCGRSVQVSHIGTCGPATGTAK